ncbi:MAG: HD domain-containing protein [Candidatus Moranbacteria bacterium]|nr:HD domain-containing protein [Candidatus Moranbacteria bacterium]
METMREALQQALKFSELLNQFRRVIRVVRVNGEDRWENDVEHSYQLAMLAWYIADARKLPLDVGLVVKYALIHDLVEVYAGDTYIYSADKKHLEGKHDREEEARKRLRSEIAEFEELHRLIVRYESREDAESRFVYALDKIQPMLNIYLDNGDTWKEKEVTLEMLFENKEDKVKISPEVKRYFDEFIQLLRENEERLFAAKE